MLSNLTQNLDKTLTEFRGKLDDMKGQITENDNKSLHYQETNNKRILLPENKIKQLSNAFTSTGEA